MMGTAVVLTANHYVVDPIADRAIALIGLLAAAGLDRRERD
jgi:hypothetical protein